MAFYKPSAQVVTEPNINKCVLFFVPVCTVDCIFSDPFRPILKSSSIFDTYAIIIQMIIIVLIVIFLSRISIISPIFLIELSLSIIFGENHGPGISALSAAIRYKIFIYLKLSWLDRIFE